MNKPPRPSEEDKQAPLLLPISWVTSSAPEVAPSPAVAARSAPAAAHPALSPAPVSASGPEIISMVNGSQKTLACQRLAACSVRASHDQCSDLHRLALMSLWTRIARSSVIGDDHRSSDDGMGWCGRGASGKPSCAVQCAHPVQGVIAHGSCRRLRHLQHMQEELDCVAAQRGGDSAPENLCVLAMPALPAHRPLYLRP